MTNKVALVTCGNSGIDYIKHEYKIDVFRSTLNLDGKEYEDFVEITAEEFYDTIVAHPDIDVSTSQTATGKMAAVYEKLQKDGYNQVLVVTISSKLSGTYQGAVLAADMVEGIDVRVFDSKSVSFGEANLILTAAKMIHSGKSIDEVIAKLEEIRDNTHIYIVVDTLKYLVKNGRLSVSKGVIGGLLKLKPLLELDKEGKIETTEKIRTTSKAQARLIEKFLEDTKGIKMDVFIAFTNNKARAEELGEELKKLCPNILNLHVVPLTPVVGAHAGPGTIGLGYIKVT